jgi:eukaryotic-like serine/threonine-protein kinase
LDPGVRVGPYEILSALGVGGMGEVYRARDAKLNRDVAIKVLLPAVANDPDRLARFGREAQVLASLNHPNIAYIHGIEESDGTRALVMELVEGPTLADRIAEGPMPLDEALPIARQIAEALEAAHEQGIVHRDLKPANVKVRADATVKVLDFGLAKAMDRAANSGATAMNSPTLSVHATQAGIILGTAAYMSPEQAKGRPTDKRSDVWAFGAVLYEMLSGERAFQGEDIADTLAAVLRHDVDWTALPAVTPTSVRRLMARCLDRDVKRRLRDIGEARIVLEDPAATRPGDASGLTVLAPPQPLWRRAMPVVLAAIAGALAVVTAGYFSGRPSTLGSVTRFSFNPPEGQVATGPASSHIIALSPDGTQLVYVANARLYLRSMSELDVRAIQGTESFRAITDPVLSPDGRWLTFYAAADRTLKKIAVTGGAAVTLCPAESTFGISWEPDGIVFGQGSKGVMRVSPNGGAPDVLVRVKDVEEAQGPQLLPGGQHVLFTLATGNDVERWQSARIVVQSLTSGERKTLIEGGSDARYVATGHLVYASGGILFAVPFDAGRLEVTGGAVAMVEGVRRSAGNTTGAAHFSFSKTGSLIYIPGPVSASNQFGAAEIALTDRKGQVERLKLPPGPYLFPRASPDGTRIAFEIDDRKEAAVWVYDLSGASSMRRLTFGGNNRFPIWTSDSKRIVFQSDREGDSAVFWQPADGTGKAERLTKPEPGESHAPERWAPKADLLLFNMTKGADLSLWTFSLQDRKATPFGDVHSSFPTGAVFSPDGLWVAYTSAERGITTIFVQPFPATGVKYQLFVKGSNTVPHKVAWSPDGKELFYVPRLGGFEAVSVTTRPTFSFGNATEVPRPFQPGPPNSRTLFDVAPTGRFLGLIVPGQLDLTAAPPIHVVLNWTEELKAKVRTGR